MWGYVGRMSLPFIKSITRVGTRDLINEHFGEPDNHIRNKDDLVRRFEQVFFGPKSTYKGREEWLRSQPAKELVFLIERYGLKCQKGDRPNL